MGIDGREGNTENTIIGSPPDMAMSVVGDEFHIVRAETIVFCNTKQLLIILVDEDNASTISGQRLEALLQFLTLVDMVFTDESRRSTLGKFLTSSPYDGFVTDAVYSLVVNEEIDVSALLPDPLHLALENVLFVNAM